MPEDKGSKSDSNGAGGEEQEFSDAGDPVEDGEEEDQEVEQNENEFGSGPPTPPPFNVDDHSDPRYRAININNVPE